MTPIEHENVHKYLKAPSLAEIDSFIKELGISDLQFERYYEMTPKTISRIKANHIQLPRRFWHFIYEKIVPTYSIPYQKRNKKLPSQFPSTLKRRTRANVNRLKDLQ